MTRRRKKPTEKARQRAVKEWEDTPSPNPRYEGATPAQVGRALLRKPACHAEKKDGDQQAEVKSRL